MLSCRRSTDNLRVSLAGLGRIGRGIVGLSTPEYGLGHTARELERLQVQARMLEPFTRQLFIEAGLEPGMRVLDVGSGVGDTAFVAAQLVGD